MTDAGMANAIRRMQALYDQLAREGIRLSDLDSVLILLAATGIMNRMDRDRAALAFRCAANEIERGGPVAGSDTKAVRPPLAVIDGGLSETKNVKEIAMARLTTMKPRLTPMAPRLGTVKPTSRMEAEIERNRKRDDELRWRRWYKTARWQRLRWEVLEDALFTCQMADCRRIYADTSQLVADHKIQHHGDEQMFWDKENIQCLCKPCHDKLKQKEERGR